MLSYLFTFSFLVRPAKSFPLPSFLPQPALRQASLDLLS